MMFPRAIRPEFCWEGVSLGFEGGGGSCVGFGLGEAGSQTYLSPVVRRLDDEDWEGIVEHKRSQTDVDAIAGDCPEDRGYEQVSERPGSCHEKLRFMVDGTPRLESLQESAAGRRRFESGLQVDLVV